MIGAEEAAAAAQNAVRQLRGHDHQALAEAIASAVLQTPVFVRMLDRPNQSYYLAPWRSARGIVAIVQVDAASGAMRSAAMFPEPLVELLLPKDRARSLARAAGWPATGEPELVWRACRESTSPFHPLYRFESGQGEVYVTTNGMVCDRLTSLGRGG